MKSSQRRAVSSRAADSSRKLIWLANDEIVDEMTIDSNVLPHNMDKRAALKSPEHKQPSNVNNLNSTELCAIAYDDNDKIMMKNFKKCALECGEEKRESYYNSNSFTQAMYNNIRSMQALESRSSSRANLIDRLIPQQLAATRRRGQRWGTTMGGLYQRLTAQQSVALTGLMVLLLFLTSPCIIETQASSASGTEAGAASSQPSSSSSTSSLQSGLLERSDNKESSNGSPSSAASSSSSSLSSSPSSIVASLSSAVASAAAAAAVAAAQSSLTSSDARSLLSSNGAPSNAASSGHHHSQHHPGIHQSRSPGLNLALKLADAIPEVPYSILHNMKKLDHAAPFYNVVSKVGGTSSGTSKESGHNLFASALSGSAEGLSGVAASQLSSLFKSPIWKRIADGYGEFTSEFRSLFRAPPNTMKGPTSMSTSKLLRDISVPAFLMLLASAIPNDWRPMGKTRRKSPLNPSDLANSAIPTGGDTSMAASENLPNFSLGPQTIFRPNFNPLASAGGNLQQAGSQRMAFNMPPQGLSSVSPFQPLEQLQGNQLARVGDINLQSGAAAAATDSLSNANWIQTSQPVSGQNNFEFTQAQQQQQQQPQVLLRRNGGTFAGQQPAGLRGQQQQPSADIDSGKIYTDSIRVLEEKKPVKGEPEQRSYSSATSFPSSSGLFGSLTSSLASVGQSKLMNKLMNVNGNDNSYRMLNFGDDQKMSLLLRHKDQLNDKHKYSLVSGSDNDNDFAHLGSQLHQQQQQQQQASETGRNSFKEGDYYHATSLVDVGDKKLSRRQQHTAGGVEQRDLSQLLPQSWKDVVKRTVNNVKHEASSQWKSIEGQLTNWVQDKLKTLPGSQAAATSSTSLAGASAPGVSNLIASVSSTAMSILGIGGKNSSSPPASSSSGSSSPSTSASSSSSPSSQASASAHESHSETGSGSNQRGGKHDGSPNRATSSQPVRGTLAGMANMIVNTLTSRQAPASNSHSSPSSSKSASPDSDDHSLSSSSSASGSSISQYPVQSSPAASSMASGTTSTVVAQSSMTARA